MTYKLLSRNGLVSVKSHWPGATIPIYIDESHFSDKNVESIVSALREFHTKTCLRFKPYRKSDDNWVIITGNETGCWSSVGLQGKGGQQVNVAVPGCMRKGSVIHEILHAAGFLHQHSTWNRDQFISVLWDNIQQSKKQNFFRFMKTIVTDYNTTYDYSSVMHYGPKFFTKNGQPTIRVLNNLTVDIGQRESFSELDIVKLNLMYNETCNELEIFDESMTDLEWFRSLLVEEEKKSEKEEAEVCDDDQWLW